MEDEMFHVKDLRSKSMETKRSQKAKQKYFSYRSNHPGTVGQPYLVPVENKRNNGYMVLRKAPERHLVMPGDKTCVRIWTKRDLWQDRTTNIWPLRPPHHYGRCRGCHTGRIGGQGWKNRKQERESLDVDADVVDAVAEGRTRWCSCWSCPFEWEWYWWGKPWEGGPEYTSYGPFESHDSEDEEVEGGERLVDESPNDHELEDALVEDFGFELVEVESETWSDTESWSSLLSAP